MTWRKDKRSSAARGYGSRWQKARLHYLAAHPLCAYCAKQGRTTAAEVIDHIKPHKGDMALFWDSSNWQPLCKHCHDSHKQREEKGSRVYIFDADGLPIENG